MTESTEIINNASARGALARLIALRHSKEIERFLKFAVVGFIGAVIDYSVFNILLAQPWLANLELHLPTGQMLAPAVIAGTAAFTLAVISNFIWNRYWTYPDSRSKSLAAQLSLFFAINIVGLFIRVLILQFFSIPLRNLTHTLIHNLNPVTATKLGAREAWLISVVIVMFWNFFINRYWTYNDVS